MNIKNKDRYPDADWLPEQKSIGTIEGRTLLLIGYEYAPPLVPNKADYPLVAIDRGEDSLFATPLYELVSHTQGKIDITEAIK